MEGAAAAPEQAITETAGIHCTENIEANIVRVIYAVYYLAA